MHVGLAGTIGEIVPLALTVAFTMLPIIATLAVVVSSQRATRGFLLSGGYAAGLGLITALATFGLDRIRVPDFKISPYISVFVGLALLALSGLRYTRRKRASTHPARSPALLRRLEGLSRPGALGLGFQFAFHPENLLLIGAASSKIVAASLPGGETALVVAIFCLIGVSTVVAPSAIYGRAGPKMKSELGSLRDWLIAQSTTITCVILAAVGVFLVIYGLWEIGAGRR